MTEKNFTVKNLIVKILFRLFVPLKLKMLSLLFYNNVFVIDSVNNNVNIVIVNLYFCYDL